MEVYRRMCLIRGFESRASRLYRDSAIPGFLHLSLGQEAAAVGACWSLHETDVITSTHRGHGHCLAKGLPAREMFAELMGRETGTNGGLGGSMHIADPARGIFGANGIVGAGLPIAVGAATASLLRGREQVVVAFFGDGAVAQGAFHEAMNLASAWNLPVIFFCENNGFSEFTASETFAVAPMAARSAGYGVTYEHVDGNDVVEVMASMTAAVASVRAGAGPVLVEATTYRWRGHYEGDPEHYRDSAEVGRWIDDCDPIKLYEERLVGAGVSSGELEALKAEVDYELDAAVAAASQDGLPDRSTLERLVTAPRINISEHLPPVDGERFRMMDAIHAALATELEDDPSVFVAGVDVGRGGNVFGLTRGLYERWPERVRDAPISEAAIVGTAVGAAMAGMRPVVEIMYLDFIGVCLDQIMNQAAKLHFMTGGKAMMGLTIRTQFGGGRSSGSQHSQSLEALLAHIPGLTVVMPSNPADAYGLLRAAIQDPNPVVFIENRLQYGYKGPRPDRSHLVPIGVSRVARAGTDVTVVSWSRMVVEVLAVAEELANEEGLDVEVIDLRTIAPLDRESLIESVKKTGRLVIVHEAVSDFGVGAEIAALAAAEVFWALDAPVIRLGALAAPAPYAPNLESAWLPDRSRIRSSILSTARI